MAGITVTREDLEGVLGTPVTDERFTAVHTAALRLIRTVYKPDPMAATGRAADVLSAVYTSIVMRLLTNPTGARSLGLGSANVTFGGSDVDIANAAVLSDSERRDLASLSARRPAYVVMRRLYESPSLPEVY